MIKRWCDSKGEGDATPGKMVREGLAEEVTSELGEESPWRGTARAEVQSLAYRKNSQEASSASVTQAKGRAQEVRSERWRECHGDVGILLRDWLHALAWPLTAL